MRYSLTTLAHAIMELTQPALDRATCFTQHRGLREAWFDRSHELAQFLLLGDETPHAEAAARTVVMFAFGSTHPPAVFWSSPLGQLLYRRGGFPPRNPTKAEAAQILGISHQAVSDLIKRGRLTVEGPRVTKDSIAARLRPQFEEV